MSFHNCGHSINSESKGVTFIDPSLYWIYLAHYWLLFFQILALISAICSQMARLGLFLSSIFSLPRYAAPGVRTHVSQLSCTDRETFEGRSTTDWATSPRPLFVTSFMGWWHAFNNFIVVSPLRPPGLVTRPTLIFW